MSVYMVERDLKGISSEQLAAAQRSAIETAARFSASGRSVRYIRSTFVPGEGHCMCLFEAKDKECVRALNEQAGLPFTRIVEAMDLTP